MSADILTLSAIELRDRLAAGQLTAQAVTRACIARVEARDPEVRAFSWFDPQAALAQAERLDALKASGAPLGPLHGLPVGVKDIIDTEGIPTENGCPVDAGRVPVRDAAVVRRLKRAGAVMFGKTVTTELAFLHPNVTRNPNNLDHTPGGSSSGSAAAVADGMVPLAIGTQTGGSVIRPASFCGITGYKPSFGAICKEGVLVQSHSLDTLGTFARDPAGAALLADVLFDPTEGEGGEAGCRLETAASSPSDRAPVLGFVKLPGWERADSALHGAFDALVERIGGQVVHLSLPDVFGDAAAHRAVINAAEMGYHLKRYLDEGAAHLGLATRTAIAEGLEVPAVDYLAAKAIQAKMPEALVPLFAQCDAILCPAAPGPAPVSLTSTGDSIFNGLWTMAGTPAITLPLLKAENGLPMGVQLVGAVGRDADLLAAAGWLWSKLKTG
ncbi:glutamyl-tRNA amidotransferase subunit A [Roseibium aquae]|uniref:Glutamyl-tRNA amidotransferase subunit A n=1 Tax=Roseibium aquae TaxID=1323746 RepID=A0A916X115_9HYPH|nr:amidase [Roseibium aquae]GGB45714.1 glutamyl-tRNA amidotransferase subunit A [Roseibium aquae]